jgi:hypothetical protein
VCCVPVASIEYADDIVAHGGQGLEKADESMFIVDLQQGHGQQLEVLAKGSGREPGELGLQTFNSGREDMVAAPCFDNNLP